MHCYKLTIAYDGTQYSGWQIQPNAPSIQEHVQEALKIIHGGQTVVVCGSGRTDAGVHASGQIAHFRVEHEFDPFRLLWSLNGLLPRDIRVKKIEKAPLHFHSQFSAIGKEYHYYLNIDRVVDPFRRLYVWHVMRKLNLTLLKEAATFFVGEHDFTSFANEAHSGTVARDPIRNLYRLDVFQSEGEIRLEFEGNGFLYKMVRNIVGTLIMGASGRLNLNEIPAIFKARDRRAASASAPPQGLCLVRVEYPNNHLKMELKTY